MPEQKSTRYSPWEYEKEQFEACHECRRKGDTHLGTLMKRRIFERDGEIHTEYKVVCRQCEKQTRAHRSKLIAIGKWSGINQPGDGLKHRSRTPNIALNREAGKMKGDGQNGLKKLDKKEG